MAVDEQNLKILLRSLRSQIAYHNQKITECDRTYNTLAKTQLVDDALPTDRDTGATMTQARRDEIYDACLPIANELLGIEEEEENE